LTHLKADGDEAVDVFRNRDENFAGHVAALFRSRCLVLQVDTGGTALDKHLGQLHAGGDASVSSVGVRNDGPQKVDVGRRGALLRRHGHPVFALFAVVKELGKEELLDLVWHGVHRVAAAQGLL
jgi:hypothetical protein